MNLLNILNLLCLILMTLLLALAWRGIAENLLRAKLGRRAGLIHLAIFLALQVGMNYSPFLPLLIEHGGAALWQITIFTLQALVMLPFFIRRTGAPRAVASIALAYFMIINASSGVMNLFSLLILHGYTVLDEVSAVTLYLACTLAAHVCIYLLSLLVNLVLRKSYFAVFFSSLFTTRLKAALTCAVCILLMHSTDITALIFPAFAIHNPAYYFAFLALDILIVLFMVFVAIFERNRERLRVQEALIVQQQSYVQSLGRLQKDMRAFRHDYQNMLGGLYLQASEGDTEAVQQIVKETMEYFEDSLGDEIQQLSHLANIQVAPVKSLCMVKAGQARQKKVRFRLEVPYPVVSVGMRTQDFLRCLGILLDNAIEAVEQAGGEVRLLLRADEGGELQVLVSNPCGQDIAVHRLGAGYSTKGKGRGTGLASYKRITRQYTHVATRLTCKDGLFEQLLHIRRSA